MEIAKLHRMICDSDYNGKKKESKEWRSKLDGFMEGVKTEWTEDCGKAAVYQVWSYRGMVHSEPIFDRSRIFMSVVAGSVEGLKRYKGSYGP